MVKRVFFLLLISVFVSSCASGPLLQTNFDGRESYRSADFKHIPRGTVLGLLTAAGKDGNMEYIKLLGEFVEEAIKKNRTDLMVVPYWQSLSAINVQGYTAEYADMVANYASTGILDKKVLNKLAGALKVRYFIQPRLVKFEQRQSTRFSLLGLTLFKTHESQIKIYIEIWDGRGGELVWIGVADTNMANERLQAAPIAFEQVARYAVENLVKKIPEKGE